MIKSDKLIYLGVILGAHGIKGEFIINSLTNPRENICKLTLFNKYNKKLDIKFIRQVKNIKIIGMIEGINTRTEAEELKDTQLFCMRSNLPTLKNEEFYINDLINLPILDMNYKIIGAVKNFLNFGAGDIVEILFEGQIKTELFPFSKVLFPEVTENYLIICLDN